MSDNRYEFAAQEGRLAEGQEKEMKYTVPGNSRKFGRRDVRE